MCANATILLHSHHISAKGIQMQTYSRYMYLVGFELQNVSSRD